MKFKTIDWPVPGYNEIPGDCFYRLASQAVVILNGEPILFEVNGEVAPMDYVAEFIHDQLECEGAMEDGARNHRCARIIQYWIQKGVLVQTYSPN